MSELHSPLVEADRALVRRLRCAAFDFDGVFTDNAVYVSETGQETVRCTRADGIGLERLRSIGVHAVVISTEVNPVVSARCRKLKLPCLQGCEDKVAALASFLTEIHVPMEDASFLGNDVNDADLLRKVGFPAVVADASPEVIPLARFQTRTPGGHGAVREFCDLVWKIQSR